LLKKSLKQGKISIVEAFECKNDVSTLMRRQPRFKNFQELNENMKHLKADTGMADSDVLIPKESPKKQSNSLPPKVRKSNH